MPVLKRSKDAFISSISVRRIRPRSMAEWWPWKKLTRWPVAMKFESGRFFWLWSARLTRCRSRLRCNSVCALGRLKPEGKRCLRGPSPEKRQPRRQRRWLERSISAEASAPERRPFARRRFILVARRGWEKPALIGHPHATWYARGRLPSFFGRHWCWEPHRSPRRFGTRPPSPLLPSQTRTPARVLV